MKEEAQLLLNKAEEIRDKMKTIWEVRCWKPNKAEFTQMLAERPDVATQVWANPVFARHSPLFLNPNDEGNEDYKELENQLKLILELFYKIR